jgi:hypothetical protein
MIFIYLCFTRSILGHEYPYAIKMKHLKPTCNVSMDDDSNMASCQSVNMNNHQHHHSMASLSTSSVYTHDFELRKRDLFTFDHTSKKLRFFHKRKTKDYLVKSPVQSSLNDESHSSSTNTTPVRTKLGQKFFGQPLDDIMKNYDQQMPPIIQVNID